MEAVSGAFTGALGTVWFLGALFSAFACYSLADKKGYGGCLALFLGALFGVFALVYYAGLPDKELKDMLITWFRYQKQMRESEAHTEPQPEDAQ